MTHSNITLFKTLVILLTLLLGTHKASAQNEIGDYNIIPPAFLSGESALPNVLIIFDNSGSMHFPLAANAPTACINPRERFPNCTYNATSRSAVARTAMQQVFNGLRGTINLGLMVYDYRAVPLTLANLPTGGIIDAGGNLFTPIRFFEDIDTNNDGTIDRLQFTNTINALNTINNPGTIQNRGGTPIEGALLHAQDYFQGNLPATQNLTGLSNNQINIPAQQCTANNYIILVTDGQPTVAAAGADNNTCTNSDNAWIPTPAGPFVVGPGPNNNVPANLTCSAQAATALFNSPQNVTTYVIGFAGNTAGINQIAAAGDGTAGTANPTQAFTANNGQALIDAFATIFGDIFERSSAFSGGSVLGSNATGTGVQIFPSLTPRTSDANGERVYWRGNLQSFFVDNDGYLRQDDNQNGQLDINSDTIFEYEIDTAADTLKFRDFGTSRGPNDTGTLRDLVAADGTNNLSPIWDAEQQLSTVHPALPAVNTPSAALVQYRRSVRNNRGYSNLPGTNGARHIFTCIDDDPIGSDAANICDRTERVAFRWAANRINSTHRHYLLGVDVDDPNLNDAADDAANDAAAQNIINFIRGDESLNDDNSYLPSDNANYVAPLYRKRTLNRLDVDETRYLLGDIINSNALQVGPRNEYSDDSYQAYRQLTLNRRNVVYVGANDGMLHAFNAGFIDTLNNGYADQLNGETAFDLGEELWAYVPQAVLPHLRFLTRTDYTEGSHVSYVDGKISAFDVQIFGNNRPDKYPNGWGTILVATTGVGGFDQQIDSNGDGSLTAADKQLRSSIIILDITDPESRPPLLAEISHPDMGAATSTPTVVREDDTGEWYLMFGSGPTDIQSHTSDQTARLFKFKLARNPANQGFVTDQGYSRTGLQLNNISDDSFVGDMSARDWTGDNIHDAVYYGTVTGTADAPGGDLRRIKLNGTNADDHTVMVRTDEPTPLAPFLTRDIDGNAWVIGYSGRYFTADDWNYQSSTWMYGIRERFELLSRGVTELADQDIVSGTGTLAVATNLSNTSSRLVNSSDIDVLATGNLSNTDDIPAPAPTNFTELENYIKGEPDIVGWRRELVEPTTEPNERFLQSPINVPGFDAMFFSTFIPPSDDCSIDSSGVRYGLSFVTGTAFYDESIVNPADSDSGLMGLTGQIINYNDISANYFSTTRITTTQPNPTSSPCSVSINVGLRGDTGETATETITAQCTDAGAKSWVEIDLTEY